jgi:Rrf2 family protein
VRLEVTRKSDLAVRILRVLAERGERVKGPELAAAVHSTPGYVPQVLTPLVRAGWVRSDPGPTGGYVLVAELTEVSLLAVIEAVEGPTDTGRCVLADRPCEQAGPCALHTPWVRARAHLLRELDRTSVADATIAGDVGSAPG